MARQTSDCLSLQADPLLAQQTLYVRVDIGKRHMSLGSFLPRYSPVISALNIASPSPLKTRGRAEVAGHYHHALLQYLQELDIPVDNINLDQRKDAICHLH